MVMNTDQATLLLHIGPHLVDLRLHPRLAGRADTMAELVVEFRRGGFGFDFLFAPSTDNFHLLIFLLDFDFGQFFASLDRHPHRVSATRRETFLDLADCEIVCSDFLYYLFPNLFHVHGIGMSRVHADLQVLELSDTEFGPCIKIIHHCPKIGHFTVARPAAIA